jgi:hypothetical protein
MAGVTGCADPKHRIDRNLMPSGRKPFFCVRTVAKCLANLK